MDELSIADIEQQYFQNIVMHVGVPVFITSISRNKTLEVFHIEDQELYTATFDRLKFRSPASRLGMMNINNSVAYVTRVPVRRMGIGINSGNINIGFLDYAYRGDKMRTVDAIQSFVSKSWVDTIKGTYPSLEKALSIAITNKSVCAFDRQFAVEANGTIHYKTKKVGMVALSAHPVVSDIVFMPEFRYLSVLLENNHEKTIGIACPT